MHMVILVSLGKNECMNKKQRFRRGIKMALLITTSILLICIISMFLMMPPSRGIIKPYLDEQGKVIENSIAEKLSYKIQGHDYGMIIKGVNQDHPVLLLLHGGPGLTDYFLAKDEMRALEEIFTVCYFEQLGTGLSYDNELSYDDMTTDRFISDIHDITLYLMDRFDQDKIYLLGHSFGSYLGIKTVKQYPELYHAYIGMSQITNQVESEKAAYKYMLDTYEDQGNEKRVKQMKAYDIFHKESDFDDYLNSNLRDLTMHELGVGTTHEMKHVVSGLFFPSLRCLDYTIEERINIWKGKVFSRKSDLMSEVYAFNAFEEIKEITIPIYFFAGIYDYTVAYDLQKAYYDQLVAPVKGFYTFESSAHSPLFEETDKAISIFKSDIL